MRPAVPPVPPCHACSCALPGAAPTKLPSECGVPPPMLRPGAGPKLPGAPACKVASEFVCGAGRPLAREAKARSPVLRRRGLRSSYWAAHSPAGRPSAAAAATFAAAGTSASASAAARAPSHRRGLKYVGPALLEGAMVHATRRRRSLRHASAAATVAAPAVRPQALAQHRVLHPPPPPPPPPPLSLDARGRCCGVREISWRAGRMHPPARRSRLA
eukprot:2627437-Pleurochrysis_carterae.AAC.3